MFRTYAILVVLTQICVGFAFAKETVVSTTGAVFVRDYTHPQLGEAWKDPSGMIWGDTVRDGSEGKEMLHDEATKYCKTIGAQLPSREDFVRLRKYMGAKYPNVVRYERRDYVGDTFPKVFLFYGADYGDPHFSSSIPKDVAASRDAGFVNISSLGFVPQGLPNLIYPDIGDYSYGTFWSSTLVPPFAVFTPALSMEYLDATAPGGRAVRHYNESSYVWNDDAYAFSGREGIIFPEIRYRGNYTRCVIPPR